jgi:hypothetical protein
MSCTAWYNRFTTHHIMHALENEPKRASQSLTGQLKIAKLRSFDSFPTGPDRKCTYDKVKYSNKSNHRASAFSISLSFSQTKIITANIEMYNQPYYCLTSLTMYRKHCAIDSISLCMVQDDMFVPRIKSRKEEENNRQVCQLM